jgi:hypothetical protein
MSANGWSVAANAAGAAAMAIAFGLPLIVAIGCIVNSEREWHNRIMRYGDEDKPRLRWERLIAPFVIAVVLTASAIGFLAYRATVWDCENGTRNSQCRPEDQVTRSDVDLDVNLDGPS